MPGETAFVGIGSNLDDPRAQVLRGLRALERLPRSTLLRRSPLYRSAPVDADGPDFVNAVAMLRTDLSPLDLLAALQDIERRHGRVRSAHHAPRTLDLDLLLYGGQTIDEPTLRVPHPRLHLRAFVLRPLLDIEPRLQAPALGPLSVWLDATRDQRLQRIEDS